MLQYPHIIGINKMPLGQHCMAFYKYDGSNMRFEYSHKKGWHKFGSRTQMINENTPTLGEAISLFMDEFSIGEIIIDRIKAEYGIKEFKAMEKITAFAEFFGEKSFAGTHFVDDSKQLKLFDISIFKKGFMLPKQFADMFSHDIGAEVVYDGILNQSFIQNIRQNTLSTTLNEGVICKGLNENTKISKYGPIWMTKIKTQSYLDKLKKVYQDEWEKFGE